MGVENGIEKQRVSEHAVATSPMQVRHDGAVAILTMADAANQNALDARFVADFCDAIDALALDPSVHALVLQGLPDVFCAGGARGLLGDLLDGKVNVEELGLPRRLIAFPVPVIAAMQGDAVGGGFALGLAADVIVMSARARYGLNFMDLGLTPGMGVTWLAPERLGTAIGEELMFSTEYRRGERFRTVPGINHVVSSEQVEPLALDVAMRIAEKPRDALTLLKSNQAASRLAAFDQARENEMRMHRDRLSRPETAALIRSNFIE